MLQNLDSAPRTDFNAVCTLPAVSGKAGSKLHNFRRNAFDNSYKGLRCGNDQNTGDRHT